jgi:hypothetical protein
MEVDSKAESSVVQIEGHLRRKYRCTTCIKNCQIPCRFTGNEFRRLVQAVHSISTGGRKSA